MHTSHAIHFANSIHAVFTWRRPQSMKNLNDFYLIQTILSNIFAAHQSEVGDKSSPLCNGSLHFNHPHLNNPKVFPWILMAHMRKSSWWESKYWLEVKKKIIIMWLVRLTWTHLLSAQGFSCIDSAVENLTISTVDYHDSHRVRIDDTSEGAMNICTSGQSCMENYWWCHLSLLRGRVTENTRSTCKYLHPGSCFGSVARALLSLCESGLFYYRRYLWSVWKGGMEKTPQA